MRVLLAPHSLSVMPEYECRSSDCRTTLLSTLVPKTMPLRRDWSRFFVFSVRNWVMWTALADDALIVSMERGSEALVSAGPVDVTGRGKGAWGARSPDNMSSRALPAPRRVAAWLQMSRMVSPFVCAAQAPSTSVCSAASGPRIPVSTTAFCVLVCEAERNPFSFLIAAMRSTRWPTGRASSMISFSSSKISASILSSASLESLLVVSRDKPLALLHSTKWNSWVTTSSFSSSDGILAKTNYADNTATCQVRGAKRTDRWSVIPVERRGHPILYPVY